MKLWVGFLCTVLASSLAAQPLVMMVAAAAALGWLLVQRRQECYLIDFTCYKASAERRANMETSTYVSLRTEPIIPEKARFQWKVLLHSGLGEETSMSRFFLNDEMVATLEEARVEMEESFIATADELFTKTEVKPQDVDIVIVTVSAFMAAPSHVSIVENHYKMKEGVKTFSFSGMGCSAGILAVNIAKDLLLVNPNSYALILFTESLTINSNYPGNDRAFVLANCVFRVGGAAVLLSNKLGDARRPKMRLVHTVRTNVAVEDEAYGCIFVTEDEDGVYGVHLCPCLLHMAAKAMQCNLSTLNRKVLPLHEQLRYAVNWVLKRVLKMEVEAYVPDFKLAFQNFCIHPGGRSVISGIGKSLRLSEYDLEPSRMALFRFGNTSSSGVWYKVAYMEGKRWLKVGERVVQIALGSGFKCNTAVWEVVRETEGCERNYWDDCIQRYPCNTILNYADDFCDPWLYRPSPSNDFNTTTA